MEEDLEQKVNELQNAQEEQKQLEQRLVAIEKKIIVGGENLLEKAEEQERLLQVILYPLHRQHDTITGNPLPVTQATWHYYR